MSEVTINIPIYFSLLFSDISSSISFQFLYPYIVGNPLTNNIVRSFLIQSENLNLLTEKFSSLILTEIVYVLNFFLPPYFCPSICPVFSVCIFHCYFLDCLRFLLSFLFLLFTHLKVYTAFLLLW